MCIGSLSPGGCRGRGERPEEIWPGGDEKEHLHPYYVVADAKGGTKWGYLDSEGIPKIEARFAEAREFSEERAAVRAEAGGAWGYVDGGGKDVIAAQFDEARAFSQGRAAVKQYGSWDFVDAKGNKVTDLRLPGVAPLGDFSDGLATVEINGLLGYVDAGGTIVIPVQFAQAAPFSEGLAQVVRAGEDRAGFIDTKGSVVIAAAWDFTRARFVGGLAAVQAAGKVSFIEPTGKPAFRETFDDALEFSEGLAAAKKDYRWGFVDRGGNWVIEPRWDWAQSFSEGLAAVTIERKIGYVDRKGEVVIPARWERVAPFKGGVARVSAEGKESLIDRAGNALWREPATRGRQPSPPP